MNFGSKPNKYWTIDTIVQCKNNIVRCNVNNTNLSSQLRAWSWVWRGVMLCWLPTVMTILWSTERLPNGRAYRKKGRFVCCLVLNLHSFNIISSYRFLTLQRYTYQILFSITHVHKRGSRWRSRWVARGRTSVGQTRLPMIRRWVRGSISITRTRRTVWGSTSETRRSLKTAKHVAAKMAWFDRFCLYSSCN